jgi:hypothetical protein
VRLLSLVISSKIIQRRKILWELLDEINQENPEVDLYEATELFISEFLLSLPSEYTADSIIAQNRLIQIIKNEV